MLCLQGTASKILEPTLGSRDFQSAAVAVGTMALRVRWASVHMEAMGLWRPLLDPVGCPLILLELRRLIDLSYYVVYMLPVSGVVSRQIIAGSG